ncbi:MAG: hypothetical protein GX318_02610 [Clostridia bacterium]|nr:hypothetical protein [Clostridia bacterium]
MAVKVGIPRALFYFYYYPLWKSFLENLGARVVVSPPTNKRIMDAGVKKAVDEACLPVKVYYGHVLELVGSVDLLFAPRLISVEKRAYICPKFMGLPDMIRSNIDGLPPMMDTTIDVSRKSKNLHKGVQEMGRFLSKSPRKITRAWEKALEKHEVFLGLTYSGFLPHEAIEIMEGGCRKVETMGDDSLKIALLGHGYNIYDEHISMNIVRNLKNMGVRVVTPDILPPEVTEAEAAKLPKRMFWTLGKRMLGGVLHYIHDSDVDGIIYVAAFGCGPDSMIADLSERFVRRHKKIPFMLLTLDEHSGEAGVLTRLEAFVDMLTWRGVS